MAFRMLSLLMWRISLAAQTAFFLLHWDQCKRKKAVWAARLVADDQQQDSERSC